MFSRNYWVLQQQKTSAWTWSLLCVIPVVCSFRSNKLQDNKYVLNIAEPQFTGSRQFLKFTLFVFILFNKFCGNFVVLIYERIFAIKNIFQHLTFVVFQISTVQNSTIKMESRKDIERKCTLECLLDILGLEKSLLRF